MSNEDKRKKAGENTVNTEEEVDEALEESYPASDPPAYSTPHKPSKTSWKKDKEKKGDDEENKGGKD